MSLNEFKQSYQVDNEATSLERYIYKVNYNNIFEWDIRMENTTI